MAKYWKSKDKRFKAVAGATLATGDVAALNSTGKAIKADATDPLYAVGVVDLGGVTGDDVELVTTGVLAGMPEGTSGYRVFVSETAGETAFTVATHPQTIGCVLPSEVATAGTATTYFINITQPES